MFYVVIFFTIFKNFTNILYNENKYIIIIKDNNLYLFDTTQPIYSYPISGGSVSGAPSFLNINTNATITTGYRGVNENCQIVNDFDLTFI